SYAFDEEPSERCMQPHVRVEGCRMEPITQPGGTTDVHPRCMTHSERLDARLRAREREGQSKATAAISERSFNPAPRGKVLSSQGRQIAHGHVTPGVLRQSRDRERATAQLGLPRGNHHGGGSGQLLARARRGDAPNAQQDAILRAQMDLERIYATG